MSSGASLRMLVGWQSMLQTGGGFLAPEALDQGVHQGVAMGHSVTRSTVAHDRSSCLSIKPVCWLMQDVVASTDVFHPSGGGAAAMAADMGVPFLGRVPLDAALSRAAEEGRSAFTAAAAPSNGVSTSQLAAGNANGTPDVLQSTTEHVGCSNRGKSRASTGALPALQMIIDKVIAAAEGSMLAA